jgi:hypothetical protein
VTLHDAKGRASSSTFSSWHATQALVKAFCLKKEFTADFLEKSDTIYRSPEFRISLLTVQDPDLWPITTMREHVRLGKEGALDSEHESMEPTTINNFRSDHVDFELFSDKQILALLNRSGNLCLEATCEYGFYANFFHGLFRSADTSKNLRRIIQVINDLEDPALVEKIRLRIAENMANSATDSQKEGVFALQGMQLLDQSKYGSILQSFVMTLCVLPAGIIEDASEYDHPSSPAFLNDYCKTPEKALLRLQEELMATPVEDFRIQHFNALGRFSSKWRHEQDFTGVDLQGLLIHCLEAFQVYSHTVHITLASMVTTDMADETREYMESLIGYAMKHIEPDYQRFEHLSQNTQVMLANGGMEVRKLPGLSRTDRGKILVDQLGL